MAAACGLSFAAQAQFEAGTIAVGGAFSFGVENSKEEDGNVTTEYDPTTTFELIPSVGYFLADDLEVGLQIGVSRFSQSGEVGDEDYKDVTTIYAFGPYARKYFSLNESAALFGQAGLMYGTGKNKYEVGSTTTESGKVSYFELGITPGVAYRFSDLVGIEFSAGFLGYSSYKEEDVNPFTGDEVTTTDSDFGLSLDLSTANLGLKLYF